MENLGIGMRNGELGVGGAWRGKNSGLGVSPRWGTQGCAGKGLCVAEGGIGGAWWRILGTGVRNGELGVGEGGSLPDGELGTGGCEWQEVVQGRTGDWRCPVENFGAQAHGGESGTRGA